MPRSFRIALAVLPLCAAAAAAQTTGAISGRVTEASGAAVAGANVEATSPSLQGARAVRSDRDGRFRLPALPPGDYRVVVSMASLAAGDRSVTVALGATVTADFVLAMRTAEEIVVSGGAPPIDLGSTTGGTTYDSATVAKLPTARNYADIVRANPAVDVDRGQTQGRALGLTIYGATSAENQWRIDGVNTTNAQRGIQGKTINSEFVQEIEVKAGGYPAEYGGALGGVVNVVTKSGGNQFHGGGFAYFDGSSTSAQQRFTDQDAAVDEMRAADFSRWDYGVDLGGYVLADRLWFFGAYDRISQSGDVSRVVASPLVSTDERFPLQGTDNLYSGKLTWNAAASTSVVASVFADPSSSSGAAGADPRQDQDLGRFQGTAIVNPDPSTWYSERTVGGTDYGLRRTQILGSEGLVSAQAAHHQDRNLLTAADEVRYLDCRAVGFCPPAVPTAVTGGFGIIDGQLDHNRSHRNEARADAAFSFGAHEVKGGAAYAAASSDEDYIFTGGQQVTILTDPATGKTFYAHFFAVPSFDDLSTPVPVVPLHASARESAAYVQDSWRVASSLTVNVGLRWDSERLYDFRGDEAFSLGSEWQPRVGLVWDPGRDGRTKLSAFAGRFAYELPTAGAAWAFHEFTAVEVFNADPVSTAPDPAFPPPFCPYGCGPGNGAAPVDLVDANLRGTYQDELSLGAERMLDATLTVAAKATYRRLGNVVEDRCDFGEIVDGATYTRCAIVNPGSGETYASGGAPVCNGYADVGRSECSPTGPPTPPARRVYRGLELVLRKTVGERFWAQGSFVYSSLTGNYDGAVNETLLSTTPGLNPDFDWPQQWHDAGGLLFLDRPYRFRLDSYWTTPLGVSIGLQAYAVSGPPLDRLGYFNGSASVFLVPRGSEGRLPTQWEANLTLSYPISLGPATVTLQAYLLDVFNNQIALTRDDDWTTGPTPGYPANIYDPTVPTNNPDLYGKFTSRQAPRSFRAAVRVSF